jgi:sugar fermentation stimulation protein A
MKFERLIPGYFLHRDNRFRATVLVAGHKAWAHLPNSGRLGELLTPHRPIWLAQSTNPNRKTAYDLKLVEYSGVLVSVDARMPNPLFAEALESGLLRTWEFSTVEHEIVLGHSRLDFRLTGEQEVCWVETKSVTLVEAGTAMFPDAPTIRGRKHLRTLEDAVEAGDRAMVVFVVQRPDAVKFIPHYEADPHFADALRSATSVGVEVLAYTCHVSLETITIGDQIPVILISE